MINFFRNMSVPSLCLTLVVVGIALYAADQAYDIGHRLGGLLYRITH